MRIGIWFAVLAASLLSSAAEAAIVEEFKVADWDGLAFTSDESGQFTHCSVYAIYQNGSTLFISYEATESWFFSVSNDSWSLTEGGNFAIRFKVDRRGELEGTGVALSATQIGLPVEPDNAFVSQLRRGNQLVITFQNIEYAFELSNSNRAMNAAQECVRRHVQLGTRSPVASRRPEVAPAPAPAPAPVPDAASGPGTADAVATGEQQEFGSWVVTATDDGAGNFVNCTAYGVHDSDQLILSYFADGIWTFGLYRAAWSLDTNQTYYLWYNVDGPADAQGVIRRPVEAAEPTRIFFQVSDVEDIIERIEGGRTLNLQFRGLTGAAETYSYPLDQVTAAFAATRQCVSDHAGGAQAENQPSKEGTGVKEEETVADAVPAEEPAAEESTADASSPSNEIPELGSKLIEEMDVPGWKAAAFSLDDDTFTHCAIKAEYQNGATLGFARTADGDLVLAITHADWTLEEGASVPISYELAGDDPLSVSGEGLAALASLIVANMGSGDALTETLRNAPQMTFKVEGTSLSFDISDVGPGVTAIDACVERHNAEEAVPAPAAKKAEVVPPAPKVETEVATAEPPVDAAAPVAEAPAAPANEVALNTSGESAIHTEAGGFTTALLFRAGYPNHIILGADTEVPPDVPPGDALWQLGAVTGSTKIVTVDATPDDIKSSIGGSMLDKCGGILNTQIVESDDSHMYFTMKCGIAAPEIMHFLVLPRDTGGSYVFALLGSADDSTVGSIAEAVYNKAVHG